MTRHFLITDQSLSNEPFKHKVSLAAMDLFFEEEPMPLPNDMFVYIDGYILPGNEHFTGVKGCRQHEVFLFLYRKFGSDFIHHVKGIFTIVLIENGAVRIYNDHLGISKFFYTKSSTGVYISNSFQLLSRNVGSVSLDGNVLAVKSLLNHEVNGETVFKNIYWSKPATRLTIEKGKIKLESYWTPETLIKNGEDEVPISHFANLFKGNIEIQTELFRQKQNVITLTGGKDSRTALAALLSCRISPYGFTYGNPASRDAVYAGLLAQHAGIPHEIVNPEKSVDWFEAMAGEIIGLNNPLVNIHRSHRYFALKRIRELLGENTAYYGGYMGGELLMGIYYDNLIFTDFLTGIWDSKHNFEKIPEILQSSFIRKEVVDLQVVSDTLSSLRTLDGSLSKRLKQFHGLFEIGILHHSQDIQIAMKLLDFPVPFFLDLDFLKALFSSKYNLLFRNSDTRNPVERHRLFRFNLNIQHLLYPQLDSVPFAKRGSYNTSEFLFGPLYWALVRSWRHFFQKQKYPPPFTYNDAYKKFILKGLNEIVLDRNSAVHDYYNVPAAIEILETSKNLSAENQWHRFSNILMHYSQLKYYFK